MTVKTCIMTLSRCYREAGSDPKVGIIVHSTGCNNTSLKRYIQPTEGSPDYDTVIKDIGKNYNRNDWNHSDVAKGVHAFIGKSKSGAVECYQVLPYLKDAWGVAAGAEGSVNYGEHACIQFEVCEDNLKSKDYFNKAIGLAVSYCALLCSEYNFSVDSIWSHKEAIAKGYGSGSRVDIDYWLGKYGHDMDWFRGMVKAEMERDTLAVGDMCMLKKDATVWNKTRKFSSWVYTTVLYVTKISGDRVWFSISSYGPTTGTTDRKYIIKL